MFIKSRPILRTVFTGPLFQPTVQAVVKKAPAGVIRLYALNFSTLRFYL